MVKKYSFSFLLFNLIFTAWDFIYASSVASSCDIECHTLFIPLSISQNLYSQRHIYAENRLDISATYRFAQAYNDHSQIIRSVLQFNPLVFTGEIMRTGDELPNALIAEYFGMAPDTHLSLDLNPQIRNQVIDLQLAMQAEHVWFQINVPIVKPQWKITKNPINNFKLSALPLQQEGTIYIYNTNTTMNTATDTLPPSATVVEGNTTLPTGYNVLPPVNLPNGGSFVPANYNGAYIFSDVDASQDDSFTGTSVFQTSDLNTGYNSVNEELDAAVTLTNTFNDKNWVVGIGTWPLVSYVPYDYTASFLYTPTGSTQATPEPATMEAKGDIVLSGSRQPIVEDGSNALLITQHELPSATSVIEALDGSYDFNGILKRRFANFNFYPNTSTSDWQSADVILWLGYDISRCGYSHLGMYLHGVIPTGTVINEEWNKYILTPVVGNGHHGQLGVGVSAGYVFCRNSCYNVTLNINGYIDHVFKTRQFRIFDKKGQPMSRYAVLKSLTYTGASEADSFNDDFNYNNLTILGNHNWAELDISNDCKGEAIADLTYESDCLSFGIGYAFSGMTEDKLACNLVKQNLPLDGELIPYQTYYGYHGVNTPISSLIMTNITLKQENVTLANECQPSGPNPCSYPLAFKFQDVPATMFPSGIPAGNELYVKSCADVTVGADSGVYAHGSFFSEEDSIGDLYNGPGQEDVFGLPDIINNRSGLLRAQILNRIFGHLDFEWDSEYLPRIGILGSYGFGAQKYLTAFYWDIGCYFGFSF
jgi:hypothetical protein